MTENKYKKDLVSIVVTTYYRNEELNSSLKSVQEITYSPIEVIVVDASASGHARPVVDRFNIDQYLPLKQDPGIAPTRQRGVEASSGDYIKFLDDGDILMPSSINNLMNEATGSDNEVLYGGLRLESGRETLPRPEVEGSVLDFALAMDMGPVVPSTMLLSRPAVKLILPLDYPDGADDDAMQIELAQWCKYSYADRVVVIMSESEDSLSNSWGHVNSHRWVLTRFSGLYEQAEPWIKSSVKAQYHRKAAAQLTREYHWTPRITVEFLKSAQYNKDNRSKLILMAIASVFGTPGLRLGEKIFSKLI